MVVVWVVDVVAWVVWVVWVALVVFVVALVRVEEPAGLVVWVVAEVDEEDRRFRFFLGMVVFFLPALRSKAATVVNRRRTRSRSSDDFMVGGVGLCKSDGVVGSLNLGGGQLVSQKLGLLILANSHIPQPSPSQ